MWCQCRHWTGRRKVRVAGCVTSQPVPCGWTYQTDEVDLDGNAPCGHPHRREAALSEPEAERLYHRHQLVRGEERQRRESEVRTRQEARETAVAARPSVPVDDDPFARFDQS